MHVDGIYEMDAFKSLVIGIWYGQSIRVRQRTAHSARLDLSRQALTLKVKRHGGHGQDTDLRTSRLTRGSSDSPEMN